MEPTDGRQRRRVFITGGAGFLGINLTRYLLARGFAVSVFDIAEFDYPERGAVDAYRGDVRDVEALRTAMRGSDIVVHGAVALPSYPAGEIMSTEVQGTVDSVDLTQDPPVLSVNGQNYTLDKIKRIVRPTS